MHHFSPALRFDIDKSGCYGTASPLVRWLELHWCPTALFSSSERSAAGMDLQDKCSCVCERESSGTKRPFQSGNGMEKVSIMRTSNQSKTKARMHKILTLWCWNGSLFFVQLGRLQSKVTVGVENMVIENGRYFTFCVFSFKMNPYSARSCWKSHAANFSPFTSNNSPVTLVYAEDN